MWMAPLSGHRRIAGVATMIAVAFAAGPVLGAPAAYAEDGEPASGRDAGGDVQTVRFTGGSLLNMLLCRSEPSKSRLTIPVNSRVVFVNRLGQPATLHVNGQALVRLAPDQAAPLVFRHGTVSVAMTFPCGAGVMEQFSSMSVTVVATGQPEPTVTVTPQPTQSVATQVSGGVPVKARAGGAGRAGLAPAGPSARAVFTATATATGAASPTAGRPAPASATALPSAPAVTDRNDGDEVAVEPLVPVSGTPRDSTSGPLALLGAVCAVVVTIAAIRSIISKRTTRTHSA
jgi:hypothetical protein